MNINDDKQVTTENLIYEYIYIVKDIANRLYIGLPYGSVDKEDLISEGTIALITCLDNYDKNKKNTFIHYARVRVVGAMKDFLRKQDILPQKKRIELKQFEKNVSELEMYLGRKATQSEIMKNLNISEKKYSELIQCMNLSSYVYIDSYEQSPLEKIEFCNDNGYFDDNLSLLSQALECSKLTNNHKRILQMYYYDEFNFKHISDTLNLSTARISQLHSQALEILKNNIHQVKENNN